MILLWYNRIWMSRGRWRGCTFSWHITISEFYETMSLHNEFTYWTCSAPAGTGLGYWGLERIRNWIELDQYLLFFICLSKGWLCTRYILDRLSGAAVSTTTTPGLDWHCLHCVSAVAYASIFSRIALKPLQVKSRAYADEVESLRRIHVGPVALSWPMLFLLLVG